MADAGRPPDFVSLKSVTTGTLDPKAAIAEIREIYFKTTKKTIDNDLAHAVALLKSIPEEEARAKAHVYMEGLAEMAREWGRKGIKRSGKVKSGKVKSGTVSDKVREP